MDKDDARRLSPVEQHERRRQVIRAYQRGRSKAQIAIEVGLSYTAVVRVISRYESGGLASLAPRTRGRRTRARQSVLQGPASSTPHEPICGPDQ